MARGLLSGRASLYQQFFQELADVLRSEGLAKTKRGLPQNWLGLGAGRSGFWYAVVFTRDDKFRVELGIDTGDYDRNKKIFDQLIKEKEEIEKEIGFQLTWNRLEYARASRIEIYYPKSVTIEDLAEDPEKKKELIKWSIDVIKKFKKTLTPRIKELKI